MTRYFYDVQTEGQYLDEVRRRRQTYATLRNNVAPELAALAEGYAQAYGGFMDPSTMQSLVMAGLPPDDPRVQQIAGMEAQRASAMGETGDEPEDSVPDAWYDTLLDAGGSILKPSVRTGLTALATAGEELDALVSSAGEAAYFDQEEGEGGFLADTFNPWEIVKDIAGYLTGEEEVGEADRIQRFWRNYTEKAARSGGLLALGDLLSGEEVDLGEGWLPAGGIYREREAAKWNLTLDGQFLTPGRLMARDITEPGSDAYNFVSGGLDFIKQLRDPSELALRIGGRARQLDKTFQAPGFRAGIRMAMEGIEDANTSATLSAGLARGTRRTVDPEEVADFFLNRGPGKALTRYLTQETNPSKIWRATGRRDMRLAQELAGHTDEAQVYDTLMANIGTHMREKPTAGPTGRFFGGIDGSDFGRVFGAGTRVRESLRNLRSFNELPGTAQEFASRSGAIRARGVMSAYNIDHSARELERWLRNAKMPTEQIDDLLSELGSKTTTVEVHQVALRAMEEAAEHLAGMGRHGLTREMAGRLTRIHEDATKAMRAFDIEDMGNHVDAMAPIREPVLDGKPFLDSPQPAILADLHSNAFYLPDAREVKRMTHTLRVLDRLEPHGLVYKGMDAASAAMSNLWKPVVLLRGAYAVRVLAEEQIRMAGMGFDSFTNHPVTALAWSIALDPKSKWGKRLARGAKKLGLEPRGTRTITDKEWDDFVEHINSMARGRAGWDGMPSHIYTGHFTKAHRTDFNYTEGWADQIAHIHNDPVMRRVAGGLSDSDWESIPEALRPGPEATQFDQVLAWWKHGDGAEFRKVLAQVEGREVLGEIDATRRLSPTPEGTPVGLFLDETADQTTAGVIEAYLRQNYFDRLERITRGDTRLTELIANGRLDDYDISLRGFDQRNLRKLLRDEYDGMGPEWVAAPVTARLRGRQGQEAGVTEMWNRLVDIGFEKIMTNPTNYISRSPTFRQLYFRRIEEVFPHASADLQRRIIQRATKAGMDRDYLRRLRRLATEGGADVSDARRLSDLDEVNMLAGMYAAEETKRLLYDMTKRNQFFDAARLIFPFGEAWKEIITAWTGIVRQNPRVVRRAQQIIQGARQPSLLPGAELATEAPPDEWVENPDAEWEGSGRGFFHPGPFGEEVFTYPDMWAGQLLQGVGTIFGIERLQNAGELIASDRVEFTGNAKGLNLAAATVLPGFGPAVQLPASQFIPDSPGWQAVKDFLLPFGATETETVGAAVGDVLLPAWMKRLQTAFQDPDRHRVFGNTVMHVQRALLNTGRYNPRTRQGMDDLNTDAKNAAKTLMILRGMAQFSAPTGPQFEWSTFDVENNLVEARLLSQDLRRLRDEYGDYDLAFEEWLRRYGVDNVLHAIPLTQELVERPVTEKGDLWLREHPEQEQQYPMTIGLFAPDPAAGEFDYSAYRRALEEGTRVSIRSADQLQLANDLLGRMQYEQAKKIAELNPGPQASIWLSSVRDRIAEEYPGFDSWVARQGLERRPRIEEMIPELRRAVADPVLAETDAGEGTQKYLTAIEIANQMMRGVDGATRYQQAAAARPVRDWLRTVAFSIIEENPDFARIWEQVFERELADDDPISVIA